MVLAKRKDEQPIPCPDMFQGKRVLIVGLGATGLSCARFLARRNVTIEVCDTRTVPPALTQLREEMPDVAVSVGALNEASFEQADIIVSSPGISLQMAPIQRAMAQGKPVVGDIEILAKCAHPPLISITGSNGKSTVTTLVGEMLQRAKYKTWIGGNIGVPALDLLGVHADADYFVLELSSFQLETTYSLHSAASVILNIAASVILNISEDHMDRYPSLQAYSDAKARIYQGTEVCVANADDPRVMAMVDAQPHERCLRFTLGEPKTDSDFGLRTEHSETWLARGSTCLLPVSQLRIQGRHNIANALAALALGSAVDAPMPAMLEALRTFTGLPHRSQWVAASNGVSWINDSKATNVGAALAAIEGIDAQKLIVILGGQGKGQDFTPLNGPLRARARHVLLLGEDAAHIQQALSGSIPQTRVDSMAEAVREAARLARSGDAVLLSPACASFDMFENYQQRGDAFVKQVTEQLS
jgi:UDP-N-acetylmuramoylalanine--D-glutamate ligase